MLGTRYEEVGAGLGGIGNEPKDSAIRGTCLIRAAGRGFRPQKRMLTQIAKAFRVAHAVGAQQRPEQETIEAGA